MEGNVVNVVNVVNGVDGGNVLLNEAQRWGKAGKKRTWFQARRLDFVVYRCVFLDC